MYLLYQSQLWIYVGSAALAGILVTVAFFLKSAPREQVLPSVILWRNVASPSTKRKWGRYFSRIGHWLWLMLTLILLTAALLGSRLSNKSGRKFVVVAEPGAYGDARKFYQKLPPDARTLIVAQSLPKFFAGWENCDNQYGVVNRSEALALAATLGGEISFWGAVPPPWLPPQGKWVQRGQAATILPLPQLKILAPSNFTPQHQWWRRTNLASEADLQLGALKNDEEIWQKVQLLQGEYCDLLQRQKLASSSLPTPEKTLPLENILWLASLGAVMIELVFWLRKKVI